MNDGLTTDTAKEMKAGGTWPRVSLKEVCASRTGARDPSERPDEPFRYVDISSIDNVAKRIVAPRTLLGRDAPSRARKIIRAGDVLVATTRPNLNAVALAPPELDDEICSTGFCVLRAGPRLLPAYLFLFVQSLGFVQTLSDLVKGALYPAVTDSQILNQEIPLPPLAEQKHIAAELMSALAAVDKTRRAAREQLAAIDALPAALLREAFNGSE